MITNRLLSLTSRAVRTPITVRALSTQKKASALKLNSQKKTNEIFQKRKQKHLNQSSNQIKQQSKRKRAKTIKSLQKPENQATANIIQ